MRVALLRVLPEEHWRSIEVYSDRLRAGLQALDTGIEPVEVRARAWSWPDLRLPTPYGRRASVRTLGLYLSRWLRYPLALRRVNADVYHILDNSYGHLAFFLDPARTVVTSHGGTSRSWRRWQPEGPAMRIFDLAFRGMLRAGHIISVSDYARQELLAETGYPAGRVHVIHHGVDPAFRPGPQAERDRWRARLLEEGDQQLILHVGHGAPRKNVATLYRALALLRGQGYRARLLRVGGSPGPQQAQLIQDLGIQGAVRHIPHVDNQALPPYYGAADIFAFPSLYEGFGIPLIEAMACGTPAVCSDLPVFREVCGDAALYASPHDPEEVAAAMARLLDDSALADGLRALGLERARHFTWEQTARETAQVYRAIEERA